MSRHLHIIVIFKAKAPARTATTKKRPSRVSPFGGGSKFVQVERLVLTDAEFESSNLKAFALGGFGSTVPLLGTKKRHPVQVYRHHYAVYDQQGDHYELRSTIGDISVKTPRYVDRNGNPVVLGRTRSVPGSFFPWSPQQRKAKKRAAVSRKRPVVLPVRTPCRAGFADRIPLRVSPTVQSRVAQHVVSAALARFRDCDWGTLPKRYWSYNDELTFNLARIEPDEALSGRYPSGLRGRDKHLLIAISPSHGPGIWAVLESELEAGS